MEIYLCRKCLRPKINQTFCSPLYDFDGHKDTHTHTWTVLFCADVNIKSVLLWCDTNIKPDSEPFVTEKKVYLKIKLYPSYSSWTVKTKQKVVVAYFNRRCSDVGRQLMDSNQLEFEKADHVFVWLWGTFGAEVYKDGPPGSPERLIVWYTACF